MKTITTNMTAWRVAPLSSPIGFTGDNMVTRLEVATDLEDGWQLKLDIQRHGNANVLDLTRDGTLFYVDLTADMLSFTGTASAQIRGLNGEKVAHSNQFDFTVRQSINAIDTFPPLEPTEMAQLEARVTAVKDAAETAKTGAELSAADAKQSETNAKQSETAAKLSEDNAKSSETAASTAAQDALTSETAAKLSETNAATSQVAAKTSETAAQESETVAAAQATAATQKAVDAAASATAAKASEDASALSESNSKASESAAKLSETNAKLSEVNAKTSETNSEASETNSLSSETKSKASETNAKTSEINAKASETNALASAGTAEAARVEAATQAGNAAAEADRSTTEADRATAEADRAEATLSSTQVKIATIDKELTNHTNILSQVNINQEAKQTITGYDNILSLSKNAANGNASFGLQGMTAQNLVVNGDFSQGTSGWYVSNGTISTANNTLSITGNGRNASVIAYNLTSIPPTEGKKVFFRAKAKETGGGCTLLTLLATPNVSGATATVAGQTTPVANTEYTFTGILTIPAGWSGNLRFRVQSSYTDAAAANGKITTVRECMAIDLTSLFGAGNEPDVVTCDKMFANWFDGMQSVASRGRVKSVGKNLFSPVDFSSKKTSGDNLNYTVTYTVKPNTAYTLSSNMPYYNPASIYFNGGNSGINGVYLDKPKTTTSDSYGNLTIHIRYVQYIGAGNAQAYNQIISGQYWLQLELGTTATPYEPYISTSKYINSTDQLRRVPNGTSDELIQRADGATDLVQRCKEYVLQASDVSAINTTAHTYKDYIVIPLSVFNGIIIPTTADTSGTDIYTTATVSRNGLVSVDLDDGVWYHFKNSNSLIFSFPKGTYADLAAAQAALAGTKIIYQLATPIITPIDTSGTLLSYPSGTTYWEPITADAGAYNNGISILATGFPIEALVTLSKVDFVSGVETKLDVSTAVIASDGLSFTHPDLVNGDIVFFTYSFADDAPQGNKTFGYYDSRYVIKDTVTSKFYQWGITVADGVPAFDLVEV